MQSHIVADDILGTRLPFKESCILLSNLLLLVKSIDTYYIDYYEGNYINDIILGIPIYIKQGNICKIISEYLFSDLEKKKKSIILENCDKFCTNVWLLSR